MAVKSQAQYPDKFRRVEMFVEVDRKEVVIVFITNDVKWAASRVGELDKGLIANYLKLTLAIP